MIDLTIEPRVEYRQDEKIVTTGWPVGRFTAAEVTDLPGEMPFRLLYVHFAPKISPINGDYSITVEVRGYKGSDQVLYLPCSIAYDTSTPGRIQNSRFTVFGNSQTGGSYPAFIGFGNPFLTNDLARFSALTPFPVVSRADRYTLSVTGKDTLLGSGSTIDGYRGFVGVALCTHKNW